MANGPLIPGIREFDRPRQRWPAWAGWLIAALVIAVVLVLAAGFVAGKGPLRSLGLTTIALQPVQYRPTSDASVIQVAVSLPASGLCREDEVAVVAFERGNRVEVEGDVTRPRRSSCPVSTLSGDLYWVDVQLDQPLGDRTVIRTSDRAPLPRESATG